MSSSARDKTPGWIRISRSTGAKPNLQVCREAPIGFTTAAQNPNDKLNYGCNNLRAISANFPCLQILKKVTWVHMQAGKTGTPFLNDSKQLVNGKEIAIYTAYYYWRDNAPNATTQAANLEYFHQYPLWIANYGTIEPLVPLPWKKGEWLFWQYTEVGDGKLFGVESKGIDLNYFNGDLAALRARFNLSDTPPPPPPDPDPLPDDDTPTGIKYLVTASPSLKVREGPGTTYNAIGLLYPNEIVEEINANSDRTWLKVRKSDGSLIGWSFATYLKKVGETPAPLKKRLYVLLHRHLESARRTGLELHFAWHSSPTMKLWKSLAQTPTEPG